jgi:hypothetical protein
MRLLFILLLLFALPAVAQIDEARELRCIGAVETGNRWMVGRAGEIGPQQMTAAARKRALDPLEYLRWLEKVVPDPTPYRLALAWAAGPAGMRDAPYRKRDEAQRAANLYYDKGFE